MKTFLTTLAALVAVMTAAVVFGQNPGYTTPPIVNPANLKAVSATNVSATTADIRTLRATNISASGLTASGSLVASGVSTTGTISGASLYTPGVAVVGGISGTGKGVSTTSLYSSGNARIDGALNVSGTLQATKVLDPSGGEIVSALDTAFNASQYYIFDVRSSMNATTSAPPSDTVYYSRVWNPYPVVCKELFVRVASAGTNVTATLAVNLENQTTHRPSSVIVSTSAITIGSGTGIFAGSSTLVTIPRGWMWVTRHITYNSAPQFVGMSTSGFSYTGLLGASTASSVMGSSGYVQALTESRAFASGLPNTASTSGSTASNGIPLVGCTVN